MTELMHSFDDLDLREEPVSSQSGAGIAGPTMAQCITYISCPQTTC